MVQEYSRVTKIRVVSELDLEPRLEKIMNMTARFDEYSADGIHRRRYKRITQMVLKLKVARIVHTETYVLLDADCILLRPATACDFNDRHGRAVVAWSPDFAQSPGQKLRVIGQYGKWIRWSGQVLGLKSVDASLGFYGVTPAVLRTQLTSDLLSYLENKYSRQDWWAKAPAFFTEYGLYFLYAQITHRLDTEHIPCEGQLYSASLWQDTPRALLDIDLLFFRQSYTLFAVMQSIRSDTGKNEKYEQRLLSLDQDQERLSPIESKRLILKHWEFLEANTDRSLDDRRPCVGGRNNVRAVATLVTRPEQLGPACLTAESIRRFFSKEETVLPLFTISALNISTALSDCFQSKARRLSPPQHFDEEFALINLFGLTDFDKIIFFAPGALATSYSATLFDRPSLSAVRQMSLKEYFALSLLVIVPDLRLNYLPLLSKLANKKKQEQSTKRRKVLSVQEFLNKEAFPKWHRHELPESFYLPRKAVLFL